MNRKYTIKCITLQEIFRLMNYSGYLIYEIGIVCSITKRLCFSEIKPSVSNNLVTVTRLFVVAPISPWIFVIVISIFQQLDRSNLNQRALSILKYKMLYYGGRERSGSSDSNILPNFYISTCN